MELNIIGGKMLKEITPQEVLQKLANEGEFTAYTGNHQTLKVLITGVNISPEADNHFVLSGGHRISHCWIEVPDEYQAYDNFEKPDINVGDVLLGKREYNKGEHLVTSIYTRRDKGYRTRVDGSCQTNNMLCRDFTLSNGKPIGKPKNSNDKSIDMV